jgi:hypothetical protein
LDIVSVLNLPDGGEGMVKDIYDIGVPVLSLMDFIMKE